MKVGFFCGAFDLIHAGHVTSLKECKNNCDYLIVALHTNPNLNRRNKRTPIQTMGERMIMLKSIKYIDEIYTYDTEEDLLNLLNALNIDIRFIGEDWEGKAFTGCDLDYKIHYCRRKHNWSSTELIGRIRA